ELRTPLTAILGWVRLLRMKEMDEKTSAHALATVERNAKAQAQLIEDLLDVSRVITGNLRLEISAVELVPVIEAAMDAVEPAVNAKMIKLYASLDPSAGPVSGDPARLQQVVWNLLSNAVKFTPRGGRVSIRLVRNHSHVEITVSDTGQGISADFLPYIFDRFRQADGSSTRRHGGLGLGLSIVRHLVELHGGTVQAESGGEGKGATFKVSLPILPLRNATFGLPIEELDEESAIRNPHSAILSGLRVLIVDDDGDARELMKAALETRGITVVTAKGVSEALDALRLERPDVMISDIGMPEEDGFSLIQRVRKLSEEQGGRTPAAAISAYVGEESRLEAGYELYVTKPLEPDELVAVVQKLAGRNKECGMPNDE
ncbi:MAG: hybrid sensor histidine kinase/response regulator, partial [Acidobacteriota bacterium]|nr:hybrid sensor histidine kinase/response regulator [Acidobacteriota bacterium]